MITLSIDTSCNTCQCALTKDGVLLGKYSRCDKRTHSVKLLPAIEDIVGNASLSPDDIDLFAVTNGPGSYTGMRIGVSTAKTMAFAVQSPVVGINTMDFLAESVLDSAGASEAALICTLINARNLRVYGCVYDKEGRRISEGRADDLSAVLEDCRRCLKEREDKGKVLFTGDGAVDYMEEITESAGDICLFADESLVYGKTEKMNEMAEKIYASGRKEDFSPEALEVDYYRAYFRSEEK